MIIVTGATGLVGGHLIWHLLQKHENLVALKRRTSSMEGIRKVISFYTDDIESYFSRIVWEVADVQDISSLERIIQEGDFIYHCAAVVDLSSNSSAILETNIQGTRNITDVCLGKSVAKLCYVSSIASCSSETPGGIIDETGVWKDLPTKSAYSRSKFYSEQIVWEAIGKGLNAVIVNPGVILGAYGSVSGSALLFERVRAGMPVYTLGGSGYVDVRDVVQVMIVLMESEIKSERFILVSENVDNKYIFDAIAGGFGKRKPWIKLGLPTLKIVGGIVEFIYQLIPGNPPFSKSLAASACKREYYSSDKIKNALKWNFISVQQSIQDICKFQQ